MAKNLQKSKSSKNKGIALVKKSNQLIEARYSFSVWEMRFFLSVIAQIHRDDDDFRVYRVWFRDIVKMFGLNKNHNSYDLLREGANKLMDKSFYVRYEDNGSPREVRYHILRKIDYSAIGKEEGRVESQEFIDISIEQEMKPFLLQLQKSFTTYDLRNIVKLGVYPIRIYELLKQYETIGKRTLIYEELKTMLELEHYSMFGTFYQRIVAPAVEEINKNTDLLVYEVEKIKEGKKVVALEFYFRRKTEEELANISRTKMPAKLREGMTRPPFNKEAFEQINDNPLDTSDLNGNGKDQLFALLYPKVVESLGVTPLVFADLVKIYSEEQFNQAIRVTNRAKIEGQIKTNASGFFIQALKNGYTDQKEELAKKKKKEEKQKSDAQAKAIDIQEERELAIRNRIRELVSEKPYITDQAIEYLQTDKKAQILISELQALYGRPLEIEDYRQNKDLRTMVLDAIMELNKNAFSDIF
jgi:plasmid replication initiation protein